MFLSYQHLKLQHHRHAVSLCCGLCGCPDCRSHQVSNLRYRWVTEVKAARLSAISFNQSAHFTWPRKMCAVGPKKTLLATIKNQKGRNLDQQPNSLYTGSIISPNNENGKLCIRPFLGK